jgi:4-hydroxybenzoate polyprenyltransferase
MKIFVNGLSYGAAVVCGHAAGSGHIAQSWFWFIAAVVLCWWSTDMLKRIAD